MREGWWGRLRRGKKYQALVKVWNILNYFCCIFFILSLGRKFLGLEHIAVCILNLQSLKLGVEQSNICARWETLQNQESPQSNKTQYVHELFINTRGVLRPVVRRDQFLKNSCQQTFPFFILPWKKNQKTNKLACIKKRRTRKRCITSFFNTILRLLAGKLSWVCV